MPELPEPKPRSHPAKRINPDNAPHQPATDTHPYAELQVTSNFSFLRGASHPDELVEQAAALGHTAIAITDINSLAGIVRAHIAAKETNTQLLVGAHLQLTTPHPTSPAPAGEVTESARPEGVPLPSPLRASVPSCLCASPPHPLSLLTLPTNRPSYARLCRLLTRGKRRAPKGQCHLELHDLLAFQEDLLLIVLPPQTPWGAPLPIDDTFIKTLQGLKRIFDDDRISLAASRLYGTDDAQRLEQLAALSSHTNIPLVAVNDVHYHIPERRPLQDVLTCIRHGCTIDQAGYRLFPHGERYLKDPAEMVRLFADYPSAIERTVQIARRASGFNLDQIKYEYPQEVCPDGKNPIAYLRELAYRGAAERFANPGADRHLFEPGGAGAHRDTSNAAVPYSVIQQLEYELALIEDLDYAKYFLTVYDIVEFARSQNILCQGRGAAANSAVCYCLGITAVDPSRIDMLFERFISKERDEPPDIDIDFEHERREEVIQYIYRKFGRHRAALTAEVITYRGRSAVRDVGKAMGLSLDCVDRLSKELDWWDSSAIKPQQVHELGLDPTDHTINMTIQLTQQILGFPRHLSQHVGGFVITQTPLEELVPIENAAMQDRTIIEWDKDDIDAMGMLKIDCLGLGMLTCIRRALHFVNSSLTIRSIPPEDPNVYSMICAADVIGIFQIESRAQMTMLPRLRPSCYYDLVIEVAIVRPGPIQGKMVHPYLRRRNGEEPVEYQSEEMKRVLGKTLGVPLFQEQAMQMAIVGAGFSAGEADRLRRAMAAWKRKGTRLLAFEDQFINGMISRGYTPDFTHRCFEQLKGFSEYGFPESHAASFALLVYISAWLKRYHPAAFAAALINSQPMGFYAPAQIVRDAREHGVQILPVDVNLSGWNCLLGESNEAGKGDSAPGTWGLDGPELRLGMRLVKGLAKAHGLAIERAVEEHGPFETVDSLWRTSGVPAHALKALAGADAFNSMGLSRRQALWQVRNLHDEPMPLFDVQQLSERSSHDITQTQEPAAQIKLPPITPHHAVIQDYAATGLSLRAHPMSFLREQLDAHNIQPAAALLNETSWPRNKPIAAAGVVLVRQRPATASGVVFITLEDETSIANLIIRPKIYQQYRKAARHSVYIIAWGRVERQGQVVHILVNRLDDLQRFLDHDDELHTKPRNFR